MSGRPEEGQDLATRMAVVKEVAVLAGVLKEIHRLSSAVMGVSGLGNPFSWLKGLWF